MAAGIVQQRLTRERQNKFACNSSNDKKFGNHVPLTAKFLFLLRVLPACKRMILAVNILHSRNTREPASACTGLTGKRNVKLLPLPSMLSAQMRPPCISIITFATESPKPHAAMPPRQMRFHLKEAVEDMRQILGRDSDAIINHGNFHITRHEFAGHKNMAALIGEHNGVLDQIAQGNRNLAAVRFDQQIIAGTDQPSR